MELQPRYNIELDYKGYLLEPRSYRVMPAPLMGSKFSTGRTAYSNMDFWQVGAMTDFTKGINQKFLVDPSSYYLSVGIDPSKVGEFRLERNTQAFTLPATWVINEKMTASYRGLTVTWFGTDLGKIFKTTTGTSISQAAKTGTGKIYNIFELNDQTFFTKGSELTWVYDTRDYIAKNLTVTRPARKGTALFTTSSAVVAGTGTQWLTDLVAGQQIMSNIDKVWYTIQSVDADNQLTLTAVYAQTGGSHLLVSDFGEATQVLTGQVTFTTGSPTVTGVGTQFVTELWIGAKVVYNNDGTFATVKSVDSATQITLTANYTGTGGTGSGVGFRGVNNLTYGMVESDYAFGWFDDGIRRSTTGVEWLPHPTDPLWVVPDSEGEVLNAIPITRGFLSGTKRGLWIFIGGSSGMNLWSFPDYASADNFKGMAKWGHYGIFSVEKQGIFYTDGSTVFPTNLNYLSEPFVFSSCKALASSGWDVFGLISDGTDWYLARCNLNYVNVPKYWWMVKKLAKTPQGIAPYSDSKIFIFYEDGSAETYNKISGPYQTSGYLITSLIDENLVRLQKFYYKISTMFEDFPANTSCTLGYRLKTSDSFTTETIAGAAQREAIMQLTNPTLGNRIQTKTQLDTTDTSKSPVVSDVLWTYYLERPSDENATKKNYFFTVICEDFIEKLDGDIQEEGLNVPRSSRDIVSDLWTSCNKKELLNFVGADNKEEIAFTLKYVGTGASCLVTIDRTNYKLTTTVDSAADQSISYKNVTISSLVSTLNALANYECTIHQDMSTSRTAHDMVPVKNVEIKGTDGRDFVAGSEVTAVIVNTQSPGQVKMNFDGYGSDRINMTLREA